MSYTEQFTPKLKSYFFIMWAILWMPLSVSLSLAFDRSSYSKVVNGIGALALIVTIPYTLVIGLPVGLSGMILGAVGALFAYVVTTLMDLGVWLFSSNSVEEPRIEPSVIEHNETTAKEDLINLAKGISAHKEGIYNYDLLKEDKAKVGSTSFLSIGAYTVEGRKYYDNASRLFTEASESLDKVIPVLRAANNRFFASVIEEAEEVREECETKLTALKNHNL